MAKTFTPQVSERTQEAIVIGKMAEELLEKIHNYTEKYHIPGWTMDKEACDDVTTLRGDVAFMIQDSIGLDRTLDRTETNQ